MLCSLSKQSLCLFYLNLCLFDTWRSIANKNKILNNYPQEANGKLLGVQVKLLMEYVVV